MLHWSALWLHSTVYHLRWIRLCMCPNEQRVETNLCGHSNFSFLFSSFVQYAWFDLRMLYCSSVILRKIVCDTYHLHYFNICATLLFPELHSTEMVWFQCIICLHVFHILFRLFAFMFDSRRFLNRDRHPAFFVLLYHDRRWTGSRAIFGNMAGPENDLNHVLSTFVDSEHEIPNFCNSRYVDISELHSLFINNGNEFLILTFNI